MKTTIRMMGMICAVALIQGCAPLFGAGVAVVADAAAEDQGGNLF